MLSERFPTLSENELKTAIPLENRKVRLDMLQLKLMADQNAYLERFSYDVRRMSSTEIKKLEKFERLIKKVESRCVILMKMLFYIERAASFRSIIHHPEELREQLSALQNQYVKTTEQDKRERLDETIKSLYHLLSESREILAALKAFNLPLPDEEWPKHFIEKSKDA